MEFPKLIQGGMGVGVSGWRLANAVSRVGQLGVVSGTALDTLFVRRLADGDPGGHMRRALDAFPFPDMARRLWEEYFIPGGKASQAPYPSAPLHQLREMRKAVELCIASNFAEVFLAKEGHKNPVGINFMEKLQMPHLSSIYGAMLAGVGYVCMGAGIPLHIPGVIDALAADQPADYKLSVTGAPQGFEATMHFSPEEFAEGKLPKLMRPRFLAIVSSCTLATTLLRRSSGKVDGLIVEGPEAGGHNAPPRGKMQLDERGEPIYGDRDRIDLESMRAMGVPFWLAGGYSSAERLAEAEAAGATGVQVGTAFAFTEESDLRSDLKATLLEQARAGIAKVFTDPQASPTGFPFKVAQLAGTYSDAVVAAARRRICDLGYLREAFVNAAGSFAMRCAAEPVDSYLAKGGTEAEANGRKCLCNALLANIGFSQRRSDGSIEPPLVTVGDDLNSIARFLAPGATSYTARQVVEAIMGPIESATATA